MLLRRSRSSVDGGINFTQQSKKKRCCIDREQESSFGSLVYHLLLALKVVNLVELGQLTLGAHDWLRCRQDVDKASEYLYSSSAGIAAECESDSAIAPWHLLFSLSDVCLKGSNFAC